MNFDRSQAIQPPQFAAAPDPTTGVAQPVAGSARGSTIRTAPPMPDAASAGSDSGSVSAPTDPADQQGGGFFKLIQTLKDQLDVVIGELLNNAAAPASGTGSAARDPLSPVTPGPGSGTLRRTLTV